MLSIVIRPSYQLIGLVGLLYLLTGGIGLAYIPLPLSLKGVGAILHGMHGYMTWYYVLSLRFQDAIIYLEYTKERQWLVANNQGELYIGRLEQGSMSTYLITVLHLKIATSEHRFIWLFPDSISSESARKLRQILWWDVQ